MLEHIGKYYNATVEFNEFYNATVGPPPLWEYVEGVDDIGQKGVFKVCVSERVLARARAWHGDEFTPDNRCSYSEPDCMTTES